ncbi:hypothetical protein [Thalassorhabdomicrobium marinisediminis]|uniref:Uncharacterized protein n=1 Tax=Thalassorhabdomicrobium marinisediminis TaxID=2170577 RepID=A0A2T7FUI0_9RHOB|nr:hypothetical protein [Thalassorhabdomicrobium marinisediminis]PVA05816.1 hypothetical protein DC363_13425 [Thalassorhabdomicrobium marinisediminis]
MAMDASFNKRLVRVVRTHERMRRNGVVHRVGRDGLIRSRPRLIRPRFPVKGAMIVVGLLLAFKALLFAELGAEAYGDRVAGLREGMLLERAGAVVMQEDPVTVAVGAYLARTVFRP